MVEGYSLLVATRAVLQGAHAMGMTFWEYLRRGMDPTTVAVMLEDGAAVAGLAIAGFCPSLAIPRPTLLLLVACLKRRSATFELRLHASKSLTCCKTSAMCCVVCCRRSHMGDPHDRQCSL